MIKDILMYLASAGGGAIIVYLLGWLRFRKTDTAGKDKLKAEASVLLTDGALRLVDRLSSDLDEARVEIDKLLGVSAKITELYDQAKADHVKEIEGLNHQLKHSKILLETKKQHCIQTKARVIQLHELLLIKNEELTPAELQEFMAKVNELIHSVPDLTQTNK